tara:strand:- start:162 stop:362 length:201 start_codon:yes stop_codon:yes gene_type:complete
MTKKTFGEYCVRCGERKPLNKRVVTSYQEDGISERSSMLTQDDATAKSKYCPTCAVSILSGLSEGT